MTTHWIVVMAMPKADVIAGKAILTAVSSGPTVTPRLTMRRASQRLQCSGTLQRAQAMALHMPYPALPSGVRRVACALAVHDGATRARPARRCRVRTARSSTRASMAPSAEITAELTPQLGSALTRVALPGEDAVRPALAPAFASTFAA